MRRLDSAGRLEVVASQEFGVLERTGLTSDQTAAAAWTVVADPSQPVTVGGARAIALALSVARDARWPTLPYSLPGVARLLDVLYGLVARYRFRFPGDRPWCVAHPDRCAAPD